jgi:hypothetical protein
VVRRQGAPWRTGRWRWPTQPTRSRTAQHGASGRERVADSGMSQDESFTCGRAARRRPALSAPWRAVRAIRPGPRLYRHSKLDPVIRRWCQGFADSSRDADLPLQICSSMSAPAIWHQGTWGFRRKSRCCQPLIRSRTGTVRAGKLSWSPDAPVGATFADVQVQRKLRRHALAGTLTEGYA